jgi:lipoprotein-anchoring transpeptidase ErfK/SrfK
MRYLYLLAFAASFFMSGCSHLGQPTIEDINCTKLAGKYTTYQEFKKCTNARKSYKVFQDKELLAKATPKNTKIKIDVSEQRARLYVGDKVAIDSPCTTGAKRKFEPNTKIYRDKRTPLGKFRITEKIRDKRSTIFGKYYRGKRCVYKGDKRKYKGSKKGLRYEGASLANWMRLTSSGIGLHASKYIKRYPGTNGCIRLPYHVSKTIFKHVQKGTPVIVSN